MKFQFYLLMLLTIHSSSQDQERVNITCEKYAIKSDLISSMPYCDVGASLIIHEENSTVFIKNINSNKFEAFLADNSEIFYFPHNIEKSMSNIKHVKITNSKLRKITQNDLKNLTNLEYLDLSGNEIKVLPENLFEFNPDLTKISFDHNKIFFVYPSAFKNIKNLTTLGFNKNRCYSDDGVSILVISNVDVINKNCFNNNLNNIIPYIELVEESQQIQIDSINRNTQASIKHNNLQNIKDQNRISLGFLKIMATLDPNYVAILTVVNTMIILVMSVILMCFILNKKSANEDSTMQNSLNQVETKSQESQNYIQESIDVNSEDPTKVSKELSYDIDHDYEIINRVENQYSQFTDPTAPMENDEDFYASVADTYNVKDELDLGVSDVYNSVV